MQVIKRILRLLMILMICLTIYLIIYILVFFHDEYEQKNDFITYEYLVNPKNYRSLVETREALGNVSSFLNEYKNKYGRYPSNDEGLVVLEEFTNLISNTWDLAEIKHYLGVYVDDPEKERSWRIIPLVYENRAGLKEEIFEHSPANNDNDRVFSIKVDHDIYVYSVSAMLDYQEYKELYSKVTKEVYFLFALIIGPLLLFGLLYLYFKPEKERFPFISRIIVAIGLLFTISMFLPKRGLSSCYTEGGIILHRENNAPQKRIELLEKYRNRGVISEDTFQKALNSLTDTKNDE